MSSHAVIIAGAGPTGLTLAAELALAGVDVAIVERRENQELAGMRAGGLHARTIEMFDQRGIAERFLAQGKIAQVAGFASTPLDISDFPTRHNYGLGLGQNHIEKILAGWVDELGVKIYRRREVTGLAQDDTGVELQLSDGTLRASYVVGCDGGRSVIRKAAGIEFPGWDPTTSWLIAEVEMTEQAPWGVRHDALGIHAIGRVPAGHVRVVSAEAKIATEEPTLRELSEALIAIYGSDFGVHSPIWLSRFTDTTRQAAKYRERRVLVAGDAAHVHPPQGGQGLNIGVQDAMNLGWKLAQVVKGVSPASLLDTYHAERHPIGARVLRNTMAQVTLTRETDRIVALREVVAELLHMDEGRKRYGGMMSGLDVRYDLGEGHALLGRRMPDLDLVTAEGPRRVFSYLHAARPVLIDFAGGIATTRVPVVCATYDGTWELPVIGAVAAPPAVLVRPDGYVAWAGGDKLDEALVTWFG
jgi:2-polyprenyl-6-methoxyphenol hydroxylase-like FAD-dependent oxidoreductase